MKMDATTAALLGSLIGGGTALAGTIVTSYVAWKTSERDRKSAAHAAYASVLRERSSVVFSHFLMIIHEIQWIAWYAANDLHALDKKSVQVYEDRVRDFYAELLGAMAATASINLNIYNELRPLLLELYDLESRAGNAMHRVIRGGMAKKYASSALRDLRSCNDDAIRMRDSLPTELNRIMRLSEIQDPSTAGS